MREKATDGKAVLRREVRAALARMSVEERAIASESARKLLAEQRVWQEARSILFFAPTSQELDIWPMLEMALGTGKLAALPRFMKDRGSYAPYRVNNPIEEVKPGHFNILEPVPGCAEVPLNQLDLFLVPGVAFDLHGRRLGRGKGFYDQMLKTVRGTTCGIAFEEQIVSEVPVEPHDIHCNCILTPTRWIEL
jgi:5-formyltetrahydrofolate cyclo-ligase